MAQIPVSAIHVGDEDGVPGSCLWLDAALATEAIRVCESTDESSFCFSFYDSLPFKQVNRAKAHTYSPRTRAFHFKDK